MHDIFNYLGFKLKDQVDHLLPLKTSSLGRGDARVTNNRQYNSDKARNKFHVGVGKVQGSGFQGLKSVSPS